MIKIGNSHITSYFYFFLPLPFPHFIRKIGSDLKNIAFNLINKLAGNKNYEIYI